MIEITIPAETGTIETLKAGDIVSVTGKVITGRDAAHHYIHTHLIEKKPEGDDADLYTVLKETLEGSFLYHCGPVMKECGSGWECISAGPTTSIREEPYEADIIREFRPAGIIGKGGMGEKTLQALKEYTSVYLHGVGGAGAVSADSIEKVEDVFKLEFGMPEAMWVLQLKDFPAIVTMDSHGSSIHEEIALLSEKKLKELI
jgi:fumarate hydratase class I